MSDESEIDVAIIGGGPIGIEAAVYGRERGLEVEVLERGRVGANVERWSHVQLFSAWELNRSRWGERVLEREGVALEPEGAYPTGAEYLETYLRPLAGSDVLAERVREHHEVRGIARRGALKTEQVGAAARGKRRFVLRVDGPAGETLVEADAVIDATGVYDIPNGLGPGGLRAMGEEAHRDEIEYYVPEVSEGDRRRYAGRHTMVVGAGYSAVTTLRDLQRLRGEAGETEITWCLRSGGEPYALIPDDPLPMRRELTEFGNAAARGEIPEIEVVVGPIRELRRDAGHWRVELVESGEGTVVEVDEIVANVGYRPDMAMFRELQVHPCWATEGPIDLAASLVGAESGADCLEQTASGVEALEHPEPDFFVLGSKSYGRHSTFLLDVGFGQIEEVFEELG